MFYSTFLVLGFGNPLFFFFESNSSSDASSEPMGFNKCVIRKMGSYVLFVVK